MTINCRSWWHTQPTSAMQHCIQPISEDHRRSRNKVKRQTENRYPRLWSGREQEHEYHPQEKLGRRWWSVLWRMLIHQYLDSSQDDDSRWKMSISNSINSIRQWFKHDLTVTVKGVSDAILTNALVSSSLYTQNNVTKNICIQKVRKTSFNTIVN